MIEEIGEAAGGVWQVLHEHGPTTTAVLAKRTRLEAGRLNQALGWLAREGKITLRVKGTAVVVALQP